MISINNIIYNGKCRMKFFKWLHVHKNSKKKKLIPTFVTFMQHHQQWNIVATPLWGKCEDETRTPKSGNMESSGTSKTLELNFRGQNTSPWGFLYTVRNFLKSRYRKWPRMSHSDIYNTSYVRKKGRESNWQFDSQPLKVGNRPDPGVCRWSATHRWKALGWITK
jgi:hypothetical protein